MMRPKFSIMTEMRLSIAVVLATILGGYYLRDIYPDKMLITFSIIYVMGVLTGVVFLMAIHEVVDQILTKKTTKSK